MSLFALPQVCLQGVGASALWTLLAVVALGCGGDTESTASNTAAGGGGGISMGGASGGASAAGGAYAAGGASVTGGSGGITPGSGGSAGGSLGGAGGSSSGGSGATGCGDTLTGVLRDFKESHPDFEELIQSDPGIVLPDLGSDGKPVYAGQAGNPTTSGKANFDQWYRDVAGVNLSSTLPIQLSKGSGAVWTYDNSSFFPLDGQGFGNEGHPHNYHFTYELHTKFNFAGGETFQFTGDDDLFVFINGKLAIDLGGVHGAESAQTDLDADAGKLGISTGNVYPLDLFFAERHTTESNFRIDTTLVFVNCGSGGSGGTGAGGGGAGGSGGSGNSGGGGSGGTIPK